MKIQPYETEELAAYLCNIPWDDSQKIAQAFSERYEMDIEQFHILLQDLLDCLSIAVSPLTNDAFIGFTKPGEWIIKKNVQQEFINSMITWISEGSGIPERGQGWQKVITKSGAPEGALAIFHPADKIRIDKKASK